MQDRQWVTHSAPSDESCWCAVTEHSQDDPRAYEAELAARERTLGPDHPDVAESLTNIAILYNQRLEFAKAQPLYERALRIYEKARGPDHADVAHCLTDLAVLHLEQVSHSACLQMCVRAMSGWQVGFEVMSAVMLACKCVSELWLVGRLVLR